MQVNRKQIKLIACSIEQATRGKAVKPTMKQSYD